MRIEDKLGDAMRRAVTDEPLPRDVWESFARRAERSRKTRIVATTAAIAAVIAVAVIAVPRITTNDRRVGVAGSPSASPNASAPASASAEPSAPPYKTHSNAEQAWAFQAPPDWRYGMFEGEYEVNPPGLPGMTVGEDTFALAVMLRAEPWDEPREDCTDASRCVVAERGPNPALFGGRDFVLYSRTTEKGGVYKVYRVDWSGTNVFCAPDTPCPTSTLQVTVYASTKDLLGRYATIGQRFVESITHL